MATAVASTGWSSFLADKANGAWWVWTATDTPELWTTRARPFWARVLTKLGRTVDPTGPITLQQADIAAVRAALVAAGQTPKFPATQDTANAEVVRAAAWITFHAPNGTPDDLWFPRNDEYGEVIGSPMIGTPLPGTGEATSAPEQRALGVSDEDDAIRKSVGLEAQPVLGTSGTGTAQPAPAGSKKGINWAAIALVAAVGGVAWWALREPSSRGGRDGDEE